MWHMLVAWAAASLATCGWIHPACATRAGAVPELGLCQGWGCPSLCQLTCSSSGALQEESCPTSLLTSAFSQWLRWMLGAWGCRRGWS